MGKIAILLVALAWPASCQTAYGLITGSVRDAATTKPICDETPSPCNATVTYTNMSTQASDQVSPAKGAFTFTALSPGIYRISVTAPGYQDRMIENLELPVAGHFALHFDLWKLSDPWHAGALRSVVMPRSHAVSTYYGPDLDTSRSDTFEPVEVNTSLLEAAVSTVIDRRELNDIPLSGRDVYTTLALEPAVTTDTVTTRGIGLSANGQRPTSSNFLLDGVENNNYFQTGSLTPISPEAVQEYRISVSNFSAEYGRTSGFLANAVTRSGSNGYHGLLFGYIGNDLLNANTFQANANGDKRVPDKELHLGYQVGGRILRQRLFFSSEFEQVRSRSFDVPQQVCLPVLALFPKWDKTSTNVSDILLTAYPIVSAATPLGTPCKNDPSASIGRSYQWSPPVSIDRSLALERLDYVPNGSDRLMWRAVLARSSRPDFVAVPYQGLNSRLSEDSTGLATAYTHKFSPPTINELHLAWTNHYLSWNRPHPWTAEIPDLAAGYGAILPSNPLPYAFTNRENDWEFSDNLSLVRGRHVITAGGGALLRRPRSVLPYLGDGIFYFESAALKNLNSPKPCDQALATDLDEFAAGKPCVFQGFFKWPNTTTEPPQLPNYTRSYANQQFDVFIDDIWRINSHLSLSTGLRYESLGALKETGAGDTSVQPGPGSSPFAQLQSATINRTGNPRSLYNPDRSNWAPRLGISYAKGRTVLRAAAGLFYDRPFDNLLEGGRVADLFVGGNRWDLGEPLVSPFQLVSPAAIEQQQEKRFPREPRNCCPTMEVRIDQNLRSPKIYSWFAGFERELLPKLTLEVNQLGSSGRHLLTVDWVNRDYSANSSFKDVAYLANQGASFYAAMATVLRYRARSAQFQIAYTWSHSIDNQSDPLLGGLDLGSATINGTGSSGNSLLFNCGGACNSNNNAFFSQEFNWRIDRGNSGFDQRQNLIAYVVWDLPHPSGSLLGRSAEGQVGPSKSIGCGYFGTTANHL